MQYDRCLGQLCHRVSTEHKRLTWPASLRSAPPASAKHCLCRHPIPRFILPTGFDVYAYICALTTRLPECAKLGRYGWHRKQIVFERYESSHSDVFHKTA